jgi:hypothetical protein
MKFFIITGTQRSGSSTIAALLRYHDGVACGWEWPHPISWLRRVEACRRAFQGDFSMLWERHQAQISSGISENTIWLGYKNLFRANNKWLVAPPLAPSLIMDRFHECMRWWRQEPEIHIVHMVRTDSLAWLRSKFIARKLGSFGAGQTYPDDVSVDIPVGTALKILRMKTWLDQRLSELSHTNPYLAIRYEDLLTDMADVARRAQRFLSLEPQVMPQQQVRTRQSAGISVDQHIGNYSELHRALERAALLNVPLPLAAQGGR